MEDIFGNLFDIMNAQNELYTKPRELAAIWVTDKPIVTGQGKTARIAPDATLCIRNGQIIDVSEDNQPTDKVIECRGTLVNQFEMDLLPLKGGEMITIKL